MSGRKVWIVSHRSSGTHPLRRIESADEFVLLGTAAQVAEFAGEALQAPGTEELRIRPLGRESSSLIDLNRPSLG